MPLNLICYLPGSIDVFDPDLDVGHRPLQLKEFLRIGERHEHQGRIDFAHARSKDSGDGKAAHLGYYTDSGWATQGRDHLNGTADEKGAQLIGQPLA